MNKSERGIIGALLGADAGEFQLYSTYARIDDPILAEIFQRQKRLVESGRDPGLETVAAEFKDHPVITPEFLVGLMEEECIPSAIPRVAQTLNDERFRSEVKRVDPYGKTAGEIADELQSAIWDFQRAGVQEWVRKEAFQRMLDEIEHSMTHGVEMVTGITPLDKVIGGLYRQEVTYIGARPSTGKTAWAVTVTYNLIRKGKSVLYIDLESGDTAIMKRLCCLETGIPIVDIHRATLTPEQLGKLAVASGRLSQLPIVISDRCGQSVGDIYQQAIQCKADCVIVDYINYLVRGDNQNNEVSQLGDIMTGFATMAKTLNIPVLILGQLNRQLEGRVDKRPRLSDIRASGRIEEVATNVYFLHYPYKFDENELPDKFEVVVGKSRHGPTGVVELRWQPEIQRFTTPIGNWAE